MSPQCVHDHPLLCLHPLTRVSHTHSRNHHTVIFYQSSAASGRSEFISKFGLVSPTVKPAILRYFYGDLTCDISSSSSLNECEEDERAKEAVEMEDPDIIWAWLVSDRQAMTS